MFGLFLRTWLGACLLILATGARAGSAAPQLGPVPAWVKAIEVETDAEAPPEQLSQGTHYLLSDQQVRVDGADRQSYRHFAMKAVNERGVESVANIEIHFDPSYQTLTLHSIVLRRGARTIPKLNAAAVRVLQREKELDALIFDGSRTAHVFLDDVRPGDIVEYAYTVRGSNPVFGGRHYGSFDLQWASPVHRLHARLLWPAGRALYLHPRNTTLQPQLRDGAGWREHEWQARRVPALRVNNEAPSWHDPYPTVQWGEFKDWAAVAAWALPLYAVPARNGGELGAEIARIAAAHPSAEQRLVEALRYVQRTIRYLGVEVGAGSHAPSPPAVVLARRFGDCKDKTLMTITMLRALGIEAWPALVHTQTRRGIAALQPSPGAFNHVLVRARIGQRDYWVDPTKAPQLGTADAISQSSYGLALVVDAATQALQDMPEGAATLNRRRIHVVFDASAGLDQPVRYTVTTVTQGRSAESLRASLARNSAEEMQKTYLNYYAQSYPGVKVERSFELHDDAVLNRLTLVEHYRIDDFWGEAEQREQRLEAHIRVPEMRAALQSPRDAIRQAPLAIEHPVELEHLTEVKLPEDWSARSETTRVEDPAFEFERKTEARPRLLSFSDRYRSRADEVSAADTPRYVANVERARDALGYQLSKDLRAAPASLTDRFNWSLALCALAMVVLWTQLALRLYRRAPPAVAPPQDSEPVGGWLVLLAIYLAAVPLLLMVNHLPHAGAFANQAWSLTTVPGGASYHPAMAPLQLFELAVFLGRLVFGVLLLVLFLERRRELPRLFIVVAWAGVAADGLDLLLSAQIPTIGDRITGADWGRLIRSALFVALWTAYLQRSTRVRDTFVHGRPMTELAAPAPLSA